MEVLILAQLFLTGLAIGLTVIALLCLMKIRKGVSITVNVQTTSHNEPPAGAAPTLSKADLSDLQQSLDKNEEERRKTAQSLDDLIGQINNIMTGGNDNGQG